MFTALAPQRERIFSFFIVFRLSETSFFVFFLLFLGVITFFGLEHIWDVMSWDLFLEFNTSGMVRHEIFSWNSTHLGWYVMRSFLGIQHIWDGTSWDLFLEFNTSFSLNFLFFWKHKKGDDATLHEHVSLEVFQWAWRNHALLGKNPSEVLEQLSRLFAD